MPCRVYSQLLLVYVCRVCVGIPPTHPCLAAQEERAGYSAEEGAFVEEAMAIHGNKLGCVEPYGPGFCPSTVEPVIHSDYIWANDSDPKNIGKWPFEW